MATRSPTTPRRAHKPNPAALAAFNDLKVAADMQRALLRGPTHRSVRPQGEARAFPEVYAVTPEGDCMEPIYSDGEPLIVSSTATPAKGDIVIVHLKPGRQWPGGYDAVVKRLVYDLCGMEFPWDPTNSNVVIPVALEQLNPPMRLNVRVDEILAVHKVIGRGVRTEDGRIVAHRNVMEAR